MSRSRSYCFTINNYSDVDEDCCRSIKCRYMVFGREVGENGTPHLQGYVVFDIQRTFGAVAKLFPRAHLEIANGDADQNFAYCSKEGDFEERGDRPMSSKRKGYEEKERWDLALENAKRGRFEEIPGDIRFRYYKTVKEIAKDYMMKPEDLSEMDNWWYVGPPRCGKSRTARENFPGAYFKLTNKWWDGYQGEENVIIDDFELDSKLGHHLKIWADRYSFLAETKGGALHIRPKRIIITSNYTIDDCFPEDPVMCAAIKSRFNVRTWKPK